MEEVGQQVMWGPELILVQEGPPLAPLMEAPKEESSTTLAQEDSATAKDEAMV